MSQMFWMITAVVLLSSVSGVIPALNVTVQTDTKPTTTTAENWLNNLLPNLMKLLGNSNSITDWISKNPGNNPGNMLVNFLPNVMKMFGNRSNTDWLLQNKLNGTENLLVNFLPNLMKMLGNLDGTESTTANVLQNWIKMLGNNADFRNWLSTNASTEMESFLSNLDISNALNAALSGIGKRNSLKEALGSLFQNASLPNWLASMLTSNPGVYQGISAMFNLQNKGGMGVLMSLVSPVLNIYSDQLMASVANGLQEMNISANCSHHTLRVLSGMLNGQMWALQYLDAIGKPQSGLLEGALFWPGSFHECLNIATPETEDSFKGNYCLLSLPIPKTFLNSLSQAENDGPNPPEHDGIDAAVLLDRMSLQYGVCIPNSCTTQDVGIMINEGLMKIIPKSLYGVEAPPPVHPVCHTEQQFTKDQRAVIVVCVLAGIGLVILLGTTYDVITLLLWQHRQSCKMSDEEDDKEKPMSVFVIKDFEAGKKVKAESGMTSTGAGLSEMASNGVSHISAVKPEEIKSDEKAKRPKPGITGGLLMAFSLYTNTKKLVNTETRAGSLGAIHGARFFSMTWVVLGHAYGTQLYSANNPLGYMKDFSERWTVQAITNAMVSVDSFFTLSGLLVSYLTLKEMAKVKSAKINWAMFYFHRFWRLTPPYMLILMTYVSLFQYWGIGPRWQPGQVEPVTCNTHWWKNLLYINNFNMVDSCMGHTWYLANDMQFYVISPLILVPLFYSKIFGLTILALFFLATFITTGVISYVNDFRAVDGRTQFMHKIYVKPWCRIGPYLVGILVGYILFKTKCKVKLHKSTVLLGWCSAVVVSLATLYGLYGETHGHPLSTEASAVYSALHRTAWGAALGWVLFACITGYGGIINTFLSWKAFIPLARLTYMTYLIHLYVMTYFNNTTQGPFYMSDISISYMFVGHLFFTYCFSFLISLSFEAPFVALERVIFRRK